MAAELDPLRCVGWIRQRCSFELLSGLDTSPIAAARKGNVVFAASLRNRNIRNAKAQCHFHHRLVPNQLIQFSSRSSRSLRHKTPPVLPVSGAVVSFSFSVGLIHGFSWKIMLRGIPWKNTLTLIMETPKAQRIRRRLAQLTEHLQEALHEFGQVVREPKSSAQKVEDLQRKIRRYTAEHERLSIELKLAQRQGRDSIARPSIRSGQRPMREYVLDMLDELGVPSPPRVVSEFGMACFGLDLRVVRFASLRRDEERAYKKDPRIRPTWVVPALNLHGFAAIPRFVASSAWDPARRLIGPRTSRVNYLKTVLAMGHRLRTFMENDSPLCDSLRETLLQYARHIPGGFSPGKELDLDQLVAKTKSELSVIEPPDESERRSAARQLSKYPPHYQLWGLPAVIEGGATQALKA